MYLYYANFLVLASRAWLSFSNGFFIHFSPRGIFIFLYNFMNNWITPLPLPFKFFSLDFKGLVVISQRFFFLLFSHRDIFGFVHIKKGVDVRTFEHRVRLTTVVEIKLSTHHLMRLGFLFLLSDAYIIVRSSLTLNDFFLSFFSFSFFLGLHAGNAKIISSLQFLFSFDSVLLLFIVIALFTLIVSNCVLFFISSLVVSFC